MKRKIIFVLIASAGSMALISGCVSASSVITAGNGIYIVKGRAIAPWNADKERKKGIRRANAFCAEQSKHIVLHAIEETGNAALLGEKATVIFECES